MVESLNCGKPFDPTRYRWRCPAGRFVIVSERALISRDPILGSCAQLGTRPPRRARNLRLPVELVATA